MDKLSKDDYIRAYLERQKAYLHSYSSEGLELHQQSTISNATPKRARHEDTKKLSFGFDTPILLPRVTEPIIGTDKRSGLGFARATRRARNTQKPHNAEILGKENKDSERVPLSALQRVPSKQKRKKGRILSESDEEREASESSLMSSIYILSE